MDAGGHSAAAGAGAGGGLDDADAAFFSRRGRRCCGCFWAPPWPSSSSPSSLSPHARRAGAGAEEWWWQGVGEGGGGAGASARRRRWWRRGVDALMKAREWSELVAGPRWKTFIRRFRRGPRHAAGAGGGGGGAAAAGNGARKLNYDPLSYALNFDEGHGGSPDGDFTGYRDFSARFAAPPGSARASMDLAPPLFHHLQPQPQPRSPRLVSPSSAAAAVAAPRG
ncbi:hypothetical protein ACP4OV_017010 [Aristida adscensionis]